MHPLISCTFNNVKEVFTGFYIRVVRDRSVSPFEVIFDPNLSKCGHIFDVSQNTFLFIGMYISEISSAYPGAFPNFIANENMLIGCIS